ncbi:MAG TPA: two-component regulator propeller domain-containing protein [Pyrinomonadaceae bacterium]
MMRRNESSPGEYSRRSLCLLGLTLCVCFTTRAERLPLKAYTTTDGLAHNVINKIVRDSRGFLWFCTADGLSRFDGYTFTNYGTEQGLPHPNVTDVLETRNGEFWVATYGGLVRFNPRGTPQARLVLLNEASTPAPMFSVIVPDDEDRQAKAATVLLEDHNGTIWCGTLKGLYRLERNADRFALLPVDIGVPADFAYPGFVTDVLEDRHGSIWIAANSGLHRRWPDGSVARYGELSGLSLADLNDVFADRQGRLWAGTRLHGFFQFVADETRATPRIVQKYSAPDGLLTNWVFQLFEASDHRFWVATDLGLVEFSPDAEPGKQFHTYTTENGLTFPGVAAVNEDSAGNLWLASLAGAMKLTHNGFVSYGEQDGLVSVNDIFEDSEGALCFRGSVLGDQRRPIFEGGKLDLLHLSGPTPHARLGRFDGQRFTWFAPGSLNPLLFGWVYEGVSLQTRNGEWWIGTGVGLYHYSAVRNFTQLKTARPLKIYSQKDGLAAPQIFRLFEDSRGDVWISTAGTSVNGLARRDHTSGELRDLANAPGAPSFKDELARSFGEDRAGNIWIGFSTGLARYRQGSFTFFTTRDGLPPGAIKYIYVDHAGRIWLASARGGLVRLDDPVAERPTFTSYTTAQGLSSNLAEVITEDKDGNIYVGNGHGVDGLDPATGHIKYFTTADGLAPGGFLAAFRDRRGELWFGTPKGLSRFLPADQPEAAPPPIMITGLRVSGLPRIVSAFGETEISMPDLAPNQNQVQVDFMSLSFAPGQVLRYQYKLEGAGVDWSSPTEQRTVNFANLAPGYYQFLVRAVNSDGVTSAHPGLITFRILPPVWERWWFLALVALALGITAYLLYRYRVTRLLEVANMRTRIATDLHDDIGANLTRISILSEVAKQQFGNGKDESANPLSSIAEIARESVASMSDIVWAINPERDSLRDLTRKMRQHADEVFTLRNIELQFNAPGPEQNLKLGVDVRRDFLLIFKEAVNNAARHSQCSKVRIDFQADGSFLSLVVSDDGVGFAPAAAVEGHGLNSMRQRAARLGGTLKVEAAEGKGTTVSATIPATQERVNR